MAQHLRSELHIHCRRVLGSPEHAEDAVQDALLRAWRSRDRLDGKERFRPWLYVIATNACIDTIKRNARGAQADIDAVADEVASPGTETHATVVGRETLELTVFAVVRLLTPRQRAVLILRDVLGWAATEVAALLETGVTAVNSALQRARGTLRAHLRVERRDEWRAPEVTETERALVARFVDAHERGDTRAALVLIEGDVPALRQICD